MTYLKLYPCVSVETACTVGQILQAQVYSDMFPFAYDGPQFNACLSVQTLKDNLEAVTDRVYDRSYQRIVLDKLMQVKYTHLNTAGPAVNHSVAIETCVSCSSGVSGRTV